MEKSWWLNERGIFVALIISLESANSVLSHRRRISLLSLLTRLSEALRTPRAIPTQATVRANPKPSEIVRLRPDIIEEREKPYFNAWIYWKEDSGRRPSEENQHKTLLLLGPEAARHSRERNASSRWSATDTGGSWQAS
ncbi:DUF6037 family protein [Pseudomonas amygdali]|uniref:DUF6037 family protein n=1 Tax=Pseudomonas amygdali TaxID=47877 RepID=UPI002E0F4B94